MCDIDEVVEGGVYTLPIPPTNVIYEGEEVISLYNSNADVGDSVVTFNEEGKIVDKNGQTIASYEGVEDPARSVVRIFVGYRAPGNTLTKYVSGSGVHIGKRILTAAHCVLPKREFGNERYERVSISYTPSVYARMEFATKKPCEESEEHRALIEKAPPTDDGPHGLAWFYPNDISVLDVEEDNTKFGGIADPVGNSNHLVVGYPAFITKAKYLTKHKYPLITYEQISNLFHGFERKVVSTASLITTPTPTSLFGHESNTLGGMSGGGVFANGWLLGLHLGGRAHNKPFNVFYPITAGLFKGPLKHLFK